MLKRLYKNMVLGVTSFFGGAAGAFLLSGAGSPGLNVLVGLVFLISLLNLSLYLKDYYQAFKKKMAQFAPPPPKPGGQGGGGGGGGGGQGGGQGGGGDGGGGGQGGGQKH